MGKSTKQDVPKKEAMPVPPVPKSSSSSSNLQKGESLPPAGMGPIAGGIFAGMFFAVPSVITVLLEPFVQPEAKLNALLGLKDPLAAPIFAALFHLFLLQWLAMCVNGARIRYNVPWPTLYVESSHIHAIKYNCAQRAHQHVLEQTPVALTLLAIASFEYPLTAGVASSLFSFSKVVGNVFGYAAGNSKAKNRGAFGYLGLLVLIGLSVLVGLRKAGYDDVVRNHVEVACNMTIVAVGPYTSAAVKKASPYAYRALEAAKPHASAAIEALKPYATAAMDAVEPYMATYVK